MKAIVLKQFGSADNFEMVEMDDPKVGEKEVLVAIKAASFNPIDYQMRQGATESKLLKSPVLGRELSGIIIERGKKASDFRVGDRVSAYVASLGSNGTYAEMISIPIQLIAKNPDMLSFAQASALPLVGMTALQCFERLNLPQDKAVFISGGAGGVGSLLIQLFLSNGHQELITTAGNADSKNHLIHLEIKPENIIDYKQQDILEIIKSKISGGKLAYCVDLVGGKMSEMCAELLQVHGVYVDVTYLTTAKAREALFDKATTIINVANYAYTLTGNEADFSFYGKTLAKLFNKVEEKTITPSEITVVGNLDVETVKKAHALMENNLTKGKKLVMLNE